MILTEPLLWLWLNMVITGFAPRAAPFAAEVCPLAACPEAMEWALDKPEAVLSGERGVDGSEECERGLGGPEELEDLPCTLELSGG
jgi:hypothetical protein